MIIHTLQNQGALNAINNNRSLEPITQAEFERLLSDDREGLFAKDLTPIEFKNIIHPSYFWEFNGDDYEQFNSYSQINFNYSRFGKRVFSNLFFNYSTFVESDLNFVEFDNCNFYSSDWSDASILGLVLNRDNFQDMDTKLVKINPYKACGMYFCSMLDNIRNGEKKSYKPYNLLFQTDSATIMAKAIAFFDNNQKTKEDFIKLALYFDQNIDFTSDSKNSPDQWSRIWKNTFYCIRNQSESIRNHITDEILNYRFGSIKPIEINLTEIGILNLSLVRPIGYKKEYKIM